MMRILMLVLLTPLLAVGQEVTGGGTGGGQREQENARLDQLNTALGNLNTLLNSLAGSCPVGQTLSGFTAGTLARICSPTAFDPSQYAIRWVQAPQLSIPLSCEVFNGSCEVNIPLDTYLAPRGDNGNLLRDFEVTTDSWHTAYPPSGGGCGARILSFINVTRAIPNMDANYSVAFVADSADRSTYMDWNATTRNLRVNAFEQPSTNNCPAVRNIRVNYKSQKLVPITP